MTALDPCSLSRDELEIVALISRETQCWYRTAQVLGVCKDTLDRIVRRNRFVRRSTITRVRAVLAQRMYGPIFDLPGLH